MIKDQKCHVVIQTAFIGDVFLSVPFLQHLKRLYPEDQIIYVAKKGVADFLLANKIIHQLVTIEKGQRSSYRSALEQLNQNNVMNLFCLHRSVRSSLFAFQIKAKKKYGFKSNLNFLFFDKTRSYPLKYPDAIRQLSLLSLVDQEINEVICAQDWSYLKYKNQHGEFDFIPDFFKINFKKGIYNIDFLENKLGLKNKKNKRIALFPGSVWETKKWPTQYYTDLAKHLVQLNCEVMLMGGADELKLADEINALVPQTVVVAGKLKLSESIEFMTTLDMIVCNDSSPSHLAALIGIPVISIFGPTTLDLGFRPWSDQSYVVENLQVDCRPCGLHGHHKCPLGHHKCMIDISVDQVFTVIKNKLPNLT